MLNTISEWLANPNRSFTDGLKIYNDYKVDSKFDQLFALENPEPDSLHFNILRQQVTNIHRILHHNPALIKPAPITIAQIDTNNLRQKFDERFKTMSDKRPTIVEGGIVDVKELPQHLQEIWFDNKEHMRNRAGLHTTMAKLGEGHENDPARQRLATEIVELDDTIAANYANIDGWWKENKLGNIDKVLKEKEAVIIKVNRINNLKNYINRAKSEMQKKPELTADRQPKIDAWQKELDELTTA